MGIIGRAEEEEEEEEEERRKKKEEGRRRRSLKMEMGAFTLWADNILFT
jgi:hypothetical protein